MDILIVEWREAARRADAVRDRIAVLGRASVPVSRDLLVELAQLEDEVVARLQAVELARLPAHRAH